MKDARPERSSANETEAGPESGLSRRHKIFLAVLTLLFVGSVIGRAAMGSGSADDSAGSGASSAARSELGRGFVAPGSTAPSTGGAVETEEPAALETFLPYLTEGSFFALLGFAVGYATRKVVKVVLVFIAIFFVAIQLLSQSGMASVDWGGVMQATNDLIFNLKENQSLTEVLTDRVPTSGAFLLGVVLGFRRG